MTDTTRSNLQQLYIAYFNRPADAAGLAYWEKIIADGRASLASVSAAFAASQEYQSHYADMHPDTIVHKIYQNLFQRDAESAGIRYWGDLLASGKLGIDTIVKNIADGALGVDQRIFASKTAAALAWTAGLDTAPEQAAYAAPAGLLHGELFLASIHSGTNMSKLLAPESIDAVLAGMAAPAQRLSLTSGTDMFASGGANDVFSAPLAGSANTLQNGDRVNGGAGQADRLEAELTSAGGTLMPDVSAVEIISIAARGGAGAANAVVLDALRMSGVHVWESVRSSADLVIEDVRLLPDQFTRDIQIVMRETDAGDVDLGVYLDQYSLRGWKPGADALRLQLISVEDDASSKPLGDSGFVGVTFMLDGVLTGISSPLINTALTYEALVLAFADAVARKPGLEHISVSLGDSFTVTHTRTGLPVTGREIVLTSSAGAYFSTTAPGVGWIAGKAFPDIYHSNMITLSTVDALPVTARLVVDDVGRGGTGGDLFVGSLNSYPAYSQGAQRFDIEVQDSSKLQTIGGGPALEEIHLRNGATTSHDGVTRLLNRGDLTVLGGSGSDITLLPGTAADQSKGIGLSDLRVLDASAMNGKFNFSAALTKELVAHYAAARDPVSLRYTGGSNDDVMSLTVDGSVLSSNARNGAHGDFSLHVAGGSGNDEIKLALPDNASGWYQQQRTLANITIDGGAGDDTIRITGTGDVVVDLGAGNDRIFLGAGDSRVSGGAGNDRIELQISGGASPADSSNDTLVYAGAFGDDVVVNFNAGVIQGADQLDFSALGGRGAAFAGTAVGKADHAITVAMLSGASDSAAKVAALYTDGAADRSYVFVAVDGANVGKVYSVIDSAAGAVTATLVGSIDLGATGWDTLTVANFV